MIVLRLLARIVIWICGLVVRVAVITWAAVWGVGAVGLCLIGFIRFGAAALGVGLTPISWIATRRPIRWRRRREAGALRRLGAGTG